MAASAISDKASTARRKLRRSVVAVKALDLIGLILCISELFPLAIRGADDLAGLNRCCSGLRPGTRGRAALGRWRRRLRRLPGVALSADVVAGDHSVERLRLFDDGLARGRSFFHQ